MTDINNIETVEASSEAAKSPAKFNKIFKLVCAILFLATLAASAVLAIVGATRVNADMNEYEVMPGYLYLFKRVTTPEDEEYSEDKVPVGIDISDSSIAGEYGIYTGDCVLGLGAYTKHAEEVLKFLKYIYEDI
jgi:hypothetical protein